LPLISSFEADKGSATDFHQARTAFFNLELVKKASEMPKALQKLGMLNVWVGTGSGPRLRFTRSADCFDFLRAI
jgi:hypothetical protein